MTDRSFSAENIHGSDAFYHSLDQKLHNLIIQYLKSKSSIDFHQIYGEIKVTSAHKKYSILRNRIYQDVVGLDKGNICQYHSRDLITDKVIESLVYKSGYELINTILKIMQAIFAEKFYSAEAQLELINRTLSLITIKSRTPLLETEQAQLVKNYTAFLYPVLLPEKHSWSYTSNAIVEFGGVLDSDTPLTEQLRNIYFTSVNDIESLQKYQMLNRYNDYFLAKHAEFIFRLFLMGNKKYSPIMYRNYLYSLTINDDPYWQYRQFIVDLWNSAQQHKKQRNISTRKSLEEVYQKAYLALIKFLCQYSEISNFGSSFSLDTTGEIIDAWALFKKRAYLYRQELSKRQKIM